MKAKYFLDTNILISMFRNKGNVRKNILEVGFKNCHVSEISIAELLYGAAKGGIAENYEDIRNVLQQFEVVSIYSCLERYGILKAELERQGMRIDEFDLLTGATALQKHLVMVTANVKHFERLPHLTVENWE